jgi:hypothetical protein
MLLISISGLFDILLFSGVRLNLAVHEDLSDWTWLQMKQDYTLQTNPFTMRLLPWTPSHSLGAGICAGNLDVHGIFGSKLSVIFYSERGL